MTPRISAAAAFAPPSSLSLPTCHPLRTPRSSLHLPSFISLLLPLVLLLSLLLSPTLSLPFTPAFTNVEVRRFVDLSSHVEEQTVAIKALNSGSSPASSYLIPIPSTSLPHLAFVEALHTQEKSTPLSQATFQRLYRDDEKKNRLVTHQVDVSGVDFASTSLTPSNVTFYAVEFPSAVGVGETVHLILFLSFTRTLTPLPSHKQQDEHQLVIYHDTSHFLSPYPSTSQKSTYKLQSSHIESYTRKHASVSSDAVEYGPFTDVPAWSWPPLSLHFQNDAPFITMLSMRKEVEISQWGNVAITEWYAMQHTGAQLTGPFSRFEYQGKGNKAFASFNSLVAYLPPLSDGIYYRDYIGNISTSHVRPGRGNTDTLVEIRPRFPMMGGWTAEFEVGYNVPARKNLYVIDEHAKADTRRQGNYLLNVPFGSMFPAAAIDRAEVRVIFPEGTSHIQWATPFEIDSADDSGLHFTHLDTTGRPVLTLTKTNLLRFHNQPFIVSYHFNKVAMMREPALVITAVMAFFLVAMAYYRVELGVGYDTPTSTKVVA